MSDFKPNICGGLKVHIPESDCDCCELLEQKITVLEECCAEVKDELGRKLEQHDILAGDNVSITYEEDGTVIINSAGGGGGSITKTDILTAMGYNELIVAMTDRQGNTHSWKVMGVRADQVNQTPQTTPTPVGEITKQEILNILGYEEFETVMTDENNQSDTWLIVGERISQ